MSKDNKHTQGSPGDFEDKSTSAGKKRGIDVPIRSVYEDAGISSKFKSRSGG